MKKTVLLLLLVSSAAIAQKMKVVSGDFKNLKGISEYDVAFDYTGLTVDKFKTEDEFLADKMKKREEKGKDEDFKTSWFADREKRYEPKFIESFNKRFDGTVKIDKGLKSAKYKMTVKTTWIHPGFNVGVARSNSKITAEITISDAANPSNVLLVVSYEKAEGAGAMGYDFDSGYRISESYAKLAKEFASDIKSKAK
ncbi:hypothetical protein FNO01nite_04760 [Flavobacterium noncentrifugens]|uniref:DUF4410 domain-containing protein n=1 Tax=Flavobacterium noncentrifugens TaxID=1128970 RepID=A0A1G8SER3_9FLAO|nr:hypothetical protein [Flavobacterium noncentrifugens]GEP49804.1 hypothetical protein FNO01nite_04760 [Flavobacterium noncentrifugens]SDJ27698.1 hypothetical protein SAMN04487935_0526 [Flavobacterium noncentrifugens]